MKRPNPLAVLGTIAADVVPQLLDKAKPEAEKLDLIMSCVPDVLAALAQKKESEEQSARSSFIAHHAAMLLEGDRWLTGLGFCQTVIETTEDEEGMRQAARRAVRLASYVYDYAENQEAVKP